MRKRRLLILGLLACFLGCGEGEKMTKQKIEKMISEKLTIGSSPEEIEGFFKDNGLAPIFYEDEGMYKERIKIKGGKDYTTHAIIIKIYVDKEKRFLHAVVEDHYTFI